MLKYRVKKSYTFHTNRKPGIDIENIKSITEGAEFKQNDYDQEIIDGQMHKLEIIGGSDFVAAVDSPSVTKGNEDAPSSDGSEDGEEGSPEKTEKEPDTEF